MREIRQSGSEGGGSRTQSVLPTPILFVLGVRNDAGDKSRLVASKRLQFIGQRRVFRGLGRAGMPELPFWWCCECHRGK